jgi:hypothetical protein
LNASPVKSLVLSENALPSELIVQLTTGDSASAPQQDDLA